MHLQHLGERPPKVPQGEREHFHLVSQHVAAKRALATLGLIFLIESLAMANPLGGLEKNWAPFLVAILIVALIYEAAVTLLEAIVYWAVLKIGFLRSLWFSFVSNLASLVVGLAREPLDPFIRAVALRHCLRRRNPGPHSAGPPIFQQEKNRC